MSDMNMKFNMDNEKRRILIVDDEMINREILRNILEEKYDVVCAETGAQALEIIGEQKEFLSLILLDLILPDLHGLEILRKIREDPSSKRIPVIVMTSDTQSEVECLTIGAIDFISKPYPLPEVVHARVLRTIELSEGRDIINSTERDSLTGLFNRDYFYRYAQQFDHRQKDIVMDAVVLDVNHFHMINERYGKNFGDIVLKRIGERLRGFMETSGGFVCRREADTFLLYCPHRTDYMELLDSAMVTLDGEIKNQTRVRMRMGIYSNVDKSIDIERRFDRAKMAADTLRSNFTRGIAFYDSAMHEAEIFSEQLLEDFHEAVRQKQFAVYYQPKFDICGPNPVLSSAEALVRWKHPELGMISPGKFIPVFEENGLIQELDSYVWRETAATMRAWKNRLGICVPVSVNVSRVDMYDADLIDNMTALVKEYGLEPRELLLEITESAYTDDSDQIIRTVKGLREAGFKIEMDDFGTGYSSLNMISSLPIDALKLDMQFIRNAFSERKDTRMLEVVLEIAETLGVPTIAEGVETAEQMFTLKAMGCDVVQGYYFSKPVPAEEYEKFLIERKKISDGAQTIITAEDAGKRRKGKTRFISPHEKDRFTYEALHDPLTGLYNYSAFEMLLQDADQDHIAVLVADVDDYYNIVSRNGNKVADQVIERVAAVLKQNFRSVDYICRIRRDEFVVIMTRVNRSMRNLVFDKVEQTNKLLIDQDGDVPGVSLSVGVAFSERDNPQGDIFEDADRALLRMKEMRRCGCAVY